MLKDENIPIIDLDELARVIVRPGRKAYKDIIKHFGSDVVLENGELDRKKIGSRVFSNVADRKKINSITHLPIMIEIIKSVLWYWITGHKIIVIDSPLLFESGFQNFCSSVIVIWVDVATQKQRLKLRDSYNDEEAEQRIQSQMSLDKKKSMASFVIDNTGGVSNTRSQVKEILKKVYPSTLHYVVTSYLIPIAVVAAVGWTVMKLVSVIL